MRKSDVFKRLQPLLWFVFSGAPILAHASEVSTAALNAILSAESIGPNEILAPAECDVLSSILIDKRSESERFKKVAKAAFELRCVSQEKERDDSKKDASDSPDPSKKFQVWDGSAVCRSSDERIQVCEHGSENGRGLFVYSSSRSLEIRPTLVCAHFESNFRNPFEHEQLVDGRCVVTEFDWRYESGRSDVYGIKNWLKSDVNHASLEIPAALKTQCSAVFPDAIYCTPTFIVFPEAEESSVGVCRLKTNDRVLGFGAFLRIGRWNSQWECDRVSMLVPDKDSRLSIAERECVPDHLGQLKTPFCRMPYLPVARKPIRTYLEW